MPELCTSYAYNFLGLELGLGLFSFLVWTKVRVLAFNLNLAMGKSPVN